jgi:predicted TIM-barrel fold metal-dependent hydrolase
VLHCIECFGVERCMFASNFPVDKVSCSYTVLWNAFKRIVDSAGFSMEDKRKLFHDNAIRCYSLKGYVHVKGISMGMCM